MQGLERVFQKLDASHKPVLKPAVKKRTPWDAELVLIVLALCMCAAITAVVLDGAGLLK